MNNSQPLQLYICRECDDVTFGHPDPEHPHSMLPACFCGSGKPLEDCHGAVANPTAG